MSNTATKEQAKEEKNLRENYHAYDGKSRSVPLALSDTLQGVAPFTNQITREEVTVNGARVFLLHGLLSDEECDYLVHATEAIGFDKHSDVKNEYPADYRSNQRLVVLSQPFADTLWRRIQPQLHYNDIAHIKPLGWATEGLWLPNHINNGLLFSRYKPGNFFRPHYDGMYKNEYGECSIYSVTVYLNDDYKGGRVLFMANKDSRADEDILYKFQPKKGTALVFNHDTLHAGEEVTGGTKYLFRTGIMFRHVESLADPNKGWEKDPLWIRNREVFKTFTALGKEGNPEKFTKTFLELQNIQLEHGRSLSVVDNVLLGFSKEILFHAFSFLPLKDMLQLAQVCKSWLTIARNGILWRNKYAHDWGEEATKFIQDSISGDRKIDPAIQQWYSIFKKRHLVEATDAPLIMFISYDVYGCISRGENTTYSKPFFARAYVDNDPWDNSYSTYNIGAGDWWCALSAKHKKTLFNFSVYSELALSLVQKLNYEHGKYPSSPHPFVIVYEANCWSTEFQNSVLGSVQRTLDNDAFAFVPAPLCSLYAKKLTQAITVGLEVVDSFCVRAWNNLEEVKETAGKLLVRREGDKELPEASSLALSVYTMIVETHTKASAKAQIPQVLVINEKRTTRKIGKIYKAVIALLIPMLEAQKWKVLTCNETEVLNGARIIAALPSFQEKIEWKSKLYEEMHAKRGKAKHITEYDYRPINSNDESDSVGEDSDYLYEYDEYLTLEEEEEAANEQSDEGEDSDEGKYEEGGWA